MKRRKTRRKAREKAAKRKDPSLVTHAKQTCIAALSDRSLAARPSDRKLFLLGRRSSDAGRKVWWQRDLNRRVPPALSLSRVDPRTLCPHGGAGRYTGLPHTRPTSFNPARQKPYMCGYRRTYTHVHVYLHTQPAYTGSLPLSLPLSVSRFLYSLCRVGLCIHALVYMCVSVCFV